MDEVKFVWFTSSQAIKILLKYTQNPCADPLGFTNCGRIH